jgi:4Fe-4S binding domain
MALKSEKLNFPKFLYQLAVFSILSYIGLRLWFDKVYTPDFEAYCPFGGLQAAGSFLTRGSLSCSMTSMQIMMGAMLLAGAFLISKLFCGYICPVGTTSEWLGKLGDRLKITLQINRKNSRWLPAVALTGLIVCGLICGSFFELPTIDVKWGTNEEILKAAVFSKEGLKNVKCFGSSTAFANHLRDVKGIYGVSTYVGSHTLKILYDKAIYNDTTIQKLLFIPEKRVLADLNSDVDSVAVYKLSIDRFFDPFDASYLQLLLRQKTQACGYQSDFACPVIVRIYFPADRSTDIKSLADIIESESLTYKSEESLFKVSLNYKVISISEIPLIMSKADYINSMYSD